jgi:hypothetical protein
MHAVVFKVEFLRCLVICHRNKKCRLIGGLLHPAHLRTGALARPKSAGPLFRRYGPAAEVWALFFALPDPHPSFNSGVCAE